jgi:hypothetical protein
MKKEYDLSKLKSRSNPYASKLKKPVTVRPLEDEYIEELAHKAEVFDLTNPEKVNELDATRMDGLDPNETFDSVKLFALCQK